MNKYYEFDKHISKEIEKEFGKGWLPPEENISIIKPSAFPGDLVFFTNPRKKKDIYSEGKLLQIKTLWASNTHYVHIYIVKPLLKNYSVKVKQVEKIKENGSARVRQSLG